MFRHWLLLRRSLAVFGTVAAAPNVALAHRADRTGLYQLDQAAVVWRGVYLSPHLRRQFVFVRQILLLHHASFVAAVSQRLFAVHALSTVHCPHAGRRVGVVRGADDHRIDVLLVNQLPPVDVRFGLGMPRGGFRHTLLVYIAQRNDILAADRPRIRSASAIGPDDADVEFLIRRSAVGRIAGAGDPDADSGQSGVLQKATAVRSAIHRETPSQVRGYGQDSKPFQERLRNRPSIHDNDRFTFNRKPEACAKGGPVAAAHASGLRLNEGTSD